MHQRHDGTALSVLAIGALLALWCAAPAWGANFVCAKDLNNDGNVTDPGETATCVTPTTGQLCPIDAVNCVTTQTCPLNAQTPCSNGSCSALQVCTGATVNARCAQDGMYQISVMHPSGETAATGQAQCTGGRLLVRVSTPDSFYWSTPGPGCDISDSGWVDATAWTNGMSVGSGNNGMTQATLTQVDSTTFRLDRWGQILLCNDPNLGPWVCTDASCTGCSDGTYPALNICGQYGATQGSAVYSATLSVPLTAKTSWTCPSSGAATADPATCNSQCTQTAACTTSPPACPVGKFQCVNNAGTFQCSPTACVDLDANPPTNTNLNTGVYTNNGPTDASGNCVGQIMIFSGRNMQCNLAGVSTAFKNCCRNTGTVATDSTGSAVNSVALSSTISGIYTTASAAVTAYQATLQIGSQADAMLAATTAAQNTAIVAFDPTTLAISLAVAVVLDYLANSCSQQDMETGLLNGSGFCYQTGQFCTKRWPTFGCVQQARSFCCFNSKLARIIHQQGRPQLTSMPPLSSNDCRGFKPEEFQYLDFSKIDLAEYYGDLKTQSMPIVQGNISGQVQKFNSKLQ